MEVNKGLLLVLVLHSREDKVERFQQVASESLCDFFPRLEKKKLSHKSYILLESFNIGDLV